MSNQLIKTTGLGKENVFPRTRILDLFDDISGLKLIDILKSFNMMFVPYLGNKSYTRNQISPELRRQGLWLTYVIDNTVYTEWYDEVAIDDTNWGSNSNWRQGSNALVGDLSISPNGTWVINGKDSGMLARGPKFEYKDFTSEDIENLKRPAIEAASIAEEQGNYAKQQGDYAKNATKDAEDAANLANSKAIYAELKGDEAIENSKEQWKPNVDNNGNLSWSRSKSVETPATQNIKGPQGNSGITGIPEDLDVINDLNGGESTSGSIKVLAAEQGKVLNEKINDNKTEVNDKLSELDTDIIYNNINIQKTSIELTSQKRESPIKLPSGNYDITISGISTTDANSIGIFLIAKSEDYSNKTLYYRIGTQTHEIKNLELEDIYVRLTVSGITDSNIIVTFDYKESLKENITNIYGSEQTLEEFIRVCVDSNNQILYGVKRNGEFYISKLPSAIINMLNEKVNKVEGKELIDSSANVFSGISNNMYSFIIGNENILFGLKKNGDIVSEYLDKRQKYILDYLISYSNSINSLIKSDIKLLKEDVFNINYSYINTIVKHGNFRDYKLKDYTSDLVYNGASHLVKSCIPVNIALSEFEIGYGFCHSIDNNNNIHQIVAYYDIHHYINLAYRINKYEDGVYKGFTDFTFNSLPSKVNYDTHKYLIVHCSSDGIIHLSGNMHAESLNYWRSYNPYDINSMIKVNMVGDNETSVTYPCFIDVDDSTFFVYRDGSSGKGNTIINRYINGRWERFSVMAQGILEDSKSSAYFGYKVIGQYFHYDELSKYFYIDFIWRTGSGKAQNTQKLSFVKTKDFINFYNYRNEKVELPLTVNSEQCYIDDSGINSGFKTTRPLSIINDSVLIAYHRYDNTPNKYSLIYYIFMKDGIKVGPIQLTNYTNKMIVSGGGSGGDASSYYLGCSIKKGTYNDVLAYRIRTQDNVETSAHYYIISANDGSIIISSDNKDYIEENFHVNEELPAFLNSLNYKENISNKISMVKIIEDRRNPKNMIRYECRGSNQDKKFNGEVTLPTEIKIIEIF